MLYLDAYSKKVEQYDGDYHSVKREISQRMKREASDNVRKLKLIQEKKIQANIFASKGVSAHKKLKTEANKLEESLIDVKREDKHLRPFTIPMQSSSEISGAGTCIMNINGIKLPPTFNESFHNVTSLDVDTNSNAISDSEYNHGDVTPLKLGPITIHKGFHLRIVGPNGCGKSTVLKSFICNEYQHQVCGIKDSNLRIGYYSQDFSDLDMNMSVIDTLYSASQGRNHTEQYIRHVAANFFLTGTYMMKRPVHTLSEGQKGLLAFASLVLLEPGLLILDECTNHINFRHLPAIAKALKEYEGGMILVTHDLDFIRKVRIDRELDLYTDVIR